MIVLCLSYRKLTIVFMPTSSIISDFFTTQSLALSRKTLNKLLQSACSSKLWKGLPADLLLFTDQLQELATLSCTMGSWPEDKQVIIQEPNWKNKEWPLNEVSSYRGSHGLSTAWDDFPRQLSKKEFLNPYLAMHRFAKYQNLLDWKASIRHLLDHALSDTAYDEMGHGVPLWELGRHLHKLVEACHLVELRTSKKLMAPT
jgi:hypothetical protein